MALLVDETNFLPNLTSQRNLATVDGIPNPAKEAESTDFGVKLTEDNAVSLAASLPTSLPTTSGGDENAIGEKSEGSHSKLKLVLPSSNRGRWQDIYKKVCAFSGIQIKQKLPWKKKHSLTIVMQQTELFELLPQCIEKNHHKNGTPLDVMPHHYISRYPGFHDLCEKTNMSLYFRKLEGFVDAEYGTGQAQVREVQNGDADSDDEGSPMHGISDSICERRNSSSTNAGIKAKRPTGENSSSGSDSPFGLHNHMPRTFVWPMDSEEVKHFIKYNPRTGKKRKKNKVLICKPEDGSQGDGIFMIQSYRDLSSKMSQSNKLMVVQEYLTKPLLLNQLKFDLRVYVVVIGLGENTRVFLCREGLGRFCTEPYQDEVDFGNSTMHLTNYSIQKRQDNFIREEGECPRAVVSLDQVQHQLHHSRQHGQQHNQHSERRMTAMERLPLLGKQETMKPSKNKNQPIGWNSSTKITKNENYRTSVVDILPDFGGGYISDSSSSVRMSGNRNSFEGTPRATTTPTTPSRGNTPSSLMTSRLLERPSADSLSNENSANESEYDTPPYGGSTPEGEKLPNNGIDSKEFNTKETHPNWGGRRVKKQPKQKPQRASNVGETILEGENESFSYVYEKEFYDEDLTKRTLTTTLRQLKEEYPSFEEHHFWDQLEYITSQFVTANQPILTATYRQVQNCFDTQRNASSTRGNGISNFSFGYGVSTTSTTKREEFEKSTENLDHCCCSQILGFDVIFDRDFKLWLLEVNNSPSLSIDEIVPDDGGTCLCMEHHHPHRHIEGAVDVKVKHAVVNGYCKIVSMCSGAEESTISVEKSSAKAVATESQIPFYSEVFLNTGLQQYLLPLEELYSYKLNSSVASHNSLIQYRSDGKAVAGESPSPLTGFSLRKLLAPLLQGSHVGFTTADIDLMLVKLKREHSMQNYNRRNSVARLELGEELIPLLHAVCAKIGNEYSISELIQILLTER